MGKGHALVIRHLFAILSMALIKSRNWFLNPIIYNRPAGCVTDPRVEDQEEDRARQLRVGRFRYGPTDLYSVNQLTYLCQPPALPPHGMELFLLGGH